MTPNGFLLIDKEAGMTSHDVVGRVRRLFHVKKVGHTGTLDPFATGLLMVFVGRATRGVEFAEGNRKTYLAEMTCGITTDTQDITGTVQSSSGLTVSKEQLLDILPAFTGEQKQTPPMYSAVKINGRKCYELARKGITIERKPRDITVFDLTLVEQIDDNHFLLRIDCSRGTYIRTLVADIGERLGCGACVSKLRRIKIDSFQVEKAHTLAELEDLISKDTDPFVPLDLLFGDYPSVTLDAEQERLCRNGMTFLIDPSLPNGKVRVYSKSGEFLMLGEIDSPYMKTVKNFFAPMEMA